MTTRIAIRAKRRTAVLAPRASGADVIIERRHNDWPHFAQRRLTGRGFGRIRGR